MEPPKTIADTVIKNSQDTLEGGRKGPEEIWRELKDLQRIVSGAVKDLLEQKGEIKDNKSLVFYGFVFLLVMVATLLVEVFLDSKQVPQVQVQPLIIKVER